MSDFKAKKSTSGALKGEAPGKASTSVSVDSQIMKPKKAAAHRQVIADAANFQNIPLSNSTSNNSTTTATDDYESGKVIKNKRANFDDDVNAVKNLPGLEGFDD